MAKADLLSPLSVPSMTTAEALSFYDSLEPVDLAFMMGRWQGKGISTNHPMDGILEIICWYGKEFIDSETVHPLLFQNHQGEIFKLKPDPTVMALSLRFHIARYPWIAPGLRWFNRFFKTEISQARLRMMENRGAVTATMVYDYLPINDSFKKIDDNSVFGLMDYKLIPQPFFFLLQRCTF
ncbi:DUF4334 domain-containing protein [Synechocystis sp. PCC 7338]|uniref:DUF4334 domain-containing protein n=1 Tax=Synechocystis sp. PCC 7338 TaxID=2732530 RepID=UPI001BB00723|nr:DUF4334 domain-containing protein [Synechocystis sp. PCC 7338]QUS60858.1 DUF4334 domain-containing protein [Synechocystis sp. PCC 7338]